jgi:hypothetical protein
MERKKQHKDYICRKTGRYITESCHVMAGRKEYCKDLIEVDEPREVNFRMYF